jgi:uncharacterized repeat protein (TIGR03803 family)
MADSAQHRGLYWRATLTLVFFLASFAVPPQSRAQTFKVLHTFHFHDGWWPQGQLVLDGGGNIYGVTGSGGRFLNCTPSHQGCGNVFKLNKNGKQVWLYSFDGGNGFGPNGGLLRDKRGNLFGVTVEGGKKIGRGGACEYGCGVVYKLDWTGKKETVLHKFTGIPQDGGFNPGGLLIEDSSGTLYGTTGGGGNNCGVVFKMGQTGKETVLYPFQCGADGFGPGTGVTRDSEGNLYGTTVYGGNSGCGSAGCGVVYELDSTGTETVLHAFSGGADGGIASSGLIRDAAGNLYGTTAYGGNTQLDICDGREGCGVVFRLSPNSGGGWTETILYNFCSQSNCTDGHRPLGGLIRDAAGNLYGTTLFGGGTHNCNSGDCGVVFKLDTTGKETVLHTFTGGTDGAWPEGGLVMDAAGNLYGTAISGGDLNCEPSYGGCGVVFKITL